MRDRYRQNTCELSSSGTRVDVSLSSWFVILLAALAANLPFLSERLFAVVPLGRSVKPVWLRLSEMVFLYFLILGAGYFLESRIGNVFSQGWQFYAITACLFIVLGYPGFVFRYLRKQRS
jgi:hypothetical protein